jgi:tetratricopeptide (TPR) repeat protein
MKWLCSVFILAVLIGCSNEKNETSPYESLLKQAPYARLTDSIQRYPKNDELYFRRAVLLNKANHPAPALVDFRKAWSLLKEESYALGISNILLDTRPDSAVLFLKDALKIIPESIFLHLILARAYDAQDKFSEAIIVCDTILNRAPEQVNALMLKADILEKKNDIPGQIVLLERAHYLLPQNLEVAHKLAYQYAETKNVKALSLTDTLIAKDSLKIHPEPFYIRGNYFVNTNNIPKALEAFDQTIGRDHRFLNAYIEKGKIQLNQKKTTDALKTFSLANRINPAFPDAWFWIGKCLEAEGHTADAKLNYEKAYGLDKTFTDAKEAADRLP